MILIWLDVEFHAFSFENRDIFVLLLYDLHNDSRAVQLLFNWWALYIDCYASIKTDNCALITMLITDN